MRPSPVANIILLASLAATACAGPQRPQHAAAWCSGVSDRECGERYAALYLSTDIYAPDDGNREGMLSWFGYRCAFDPASIEAADSATEQGLDCFRAGQLSLLDSKVVRAREYYERACEETRYPDACDAAAELEREKIDLKAAHAWQCRGKQGAEERQLNLPRYDHLDCDAGADTGRRLREQELAKLGRPGYAPNLVECAMHGCTLADGRFIKKWIKTPQ